MIFVSVGTRPEPFTRLVSAMDLVAAQIDEVVVIQTGHTPATLHTAQAYPWLNEAEYQSMVDQARIIICQAGAGSILSARIHMRPLIVVARERRFHECPDDHQWELAQAVDASGYAQFVRDISPSSFHAALRKAVYHYDRPLTPSPLIAELRQHLADWNQPSSSWIHRLLRKGS